MEDKVKVGTWEQLRIHPTKLVKMVVEGRATVVGNDKYGRHIYKIEGRNDERQTPT